MDEEMIFPVMQQQAKNIFTTEVRGTQHTYYLTGPITDPENYVELCNILRSSGPQDEIIIRLNSRGGSVASERMIVNSIQESQANVIGFIEYDCMSAATGIFLACKQHDWADHIQFMAHCAWWGAIGKNPDIKSQTEFGLKQMEEEIVTTYSGLLTTEELNLCNDGKEFWFGSKELEQRMQGFYEHRQALAENCDCEECQAAEDNGNFNPQQSLQDMIAGAVEAGVKKALAARDKADATKAKKAAKVVDKTPKE